ncbi:hypothetical protein L596_017613 [Steinernema carpocapsae]|uniref:Uncharacterized protein n=1 Tax=Steinernema carpocapsae TaxID=34508 RepID=A0A4V6A1S5_STECR|nr:hypothetical protein L596_017613 [Steinernema carpocapsae]
MAVATMAAAMSSSSAGGPSPAGWVPTRLWAGLGTIRVDDDGRTRRMEEERRPFATRATQGGQRRRWRRQSHRRRLPLRNSSGVRTAKKRFKLSGSRGSPQDRGIGKREGDRDDCVVWLL